MKSTFKLNGGLSLNKETLSRINEQQMRAIAGGANAAPTSNTGTVVDGIAGSDCCSYAESACC